MIPKSGCRFSEKIMLHQKRLSVAASEPGEEQIECRDDRIAGTRRRRAGGSEHALAHGDKLLRDDDERLAVDLDGRVQAVRKGARVRRLEWCDDDRVEAAHQKIALQRHQERLPLPTA